MQMSTQNHPIKQESRRWPNQEGGRIKNQTLYCFLICLLSLFTLHFKYSYLHWIFTDDAHVYIFLDNWLRLLCCDRAHYVHIHHTREEHIITRTLWFISQLYTYPLSFHYWAECSSSLYFTGLFYTNLFIVLHQAYIRDILDILGGVSNYDEYQR